MTDHTHTHPTEGKTNPTLGHLYLVKTIYNGDHYVVADSFDDAVWRLHEYMRRAGQWPRVALTPEDGDAGIWVNDHEIGSVNDRGSVIL